MVKNNTRTVIKHSFVRAGRDAKGRAKAHVDYVAYRPGKENEKESRHFFGSRKDLIFPGAVKKEIDLLEERGTLIHKLIISPGVEGADVKEFARDVLKHLQQKKGLDLEFYGVVHSNTDHEHAHVIVFGKDKHGSPVRIYKKDYESLRNFGDGLTEPLKEKELEREHSKSLSKNILANLSRLGLPFTMGSKNVDIEKQLDRAAHELVAIGDPPKWEKMQRIKTLEEKCKKDRQEKEIQIYHCAIPTVYTSRTPKEELSKLIIDYDAGYYRDQLRHKDSMVVREWIKSWESWERETTQVERKDAKAARRISLIEVAVGTDEIETFSRDSQLKQLEGLKQKHEAGEVMLNSAEEKALAKWIGEKQRQQPVNAILNGQLVTCKHSDDLAKLQEVAKVSKDLLPEAEYKRLWSWIFQKRLHLEIDQPIELKSPLGRLIYNRHDDRETLEVIYDKYKSREKWVVEQLGKKEYDRLCRWLSEKSDKQEKQYPLPWL